MQENNCNIHPGEERTRCNLKICGRRPGDPESKGNLPYIVDPVKSLTKKHRVNNSYGQAKVVYVTQCRKPEDMKAAMRVTHAELASRNYIIRLKDMSEDDLQFIMNVLIRHFDPWRIVRKEDSITTPIRLVGDPTCTGLNLTSAKGETSLIL